MMARLRYIGELVPINDQIPKIVAFLCAPRSNGGGAEKLTPVGTGFFVGVPGERPNTHHWYLATARHIVDTESNLHVRVRLNNGRLDDLPIGNWVKTKSTAEDVVVAPFGYREDLDHKIWTTDGFLSDADEPPYLGDNVYFIGLLTFIEAMAARGVPMVRSGTLGVMDQAGIPVKMPDKTLAKMRGHLIDCRAYRGFSGSPCFVQDPQGTTRLLGVVSAHFDASDEMPLRGDLLQGASAEVPIHAGVGVVAPVELLRRLLDDERLVKMRKEAEAGTLAGDARRCKELAATADISRDEPHEFMRFEDLARKVIQVPKSELDEKRKES